MSAPKRDGAPSKIIKAEEMGDANLKGGLLRLADFVKTQEIDKVAKQKIRDKVIALYRLERDRFLNQSHSNSVFEGLGSVLQFEKGNGHSSYGPPARSAAGPQVNVAGVATPNLSGDVQNFNDEIEALISEPLPVTQDDTAGGDESEFDALDFASHNKKD